MRGGLRRPGPRLGLRAVRRIEARLEMLLRMRSRWRSRRRVEARVGMPLRMCLRMRSRRRLEARVGRRIGRPARWRRGVRPARLLEALTRRRCGRRIERRSRHCVGARFGRRLRLGPERAPGRGAGRSVGRGSVRDLRPCCAACLRRSARRAPRFAAPGVGWALPGIEWPVRFVRCVASCCAGPASIGVAVSMRLRRRGVISHGAALRCLVAVRSAPRIGAALLRARRRRARFAIAFEPGLRERRPCARRTAPQRSAVLRSLRSVLELEGGHGVLRRCARRSQRAASYSAGPNSSCSASAYCAWPIAFALWCEPPSTRTKRFGVRARS